MEKCAQSEARGVAHQFLLRRANSTRRNLHFEESLMRALTVLLLAMTVLLASCAIYVPDDGHRGGRGGPGNDFCPPGQAKKGNC